MSSKLKTFLTSSRTKVTYFPANSSFFKYPVWSVEWTMGEDQAFYVDVKESDRPEGGFEVVGKDAYPEGFIGLAVRAVESFELMSDDEERRAVAETQVVPLDELRAIADEAKQNAA